RERVDQLSEELRFPVDVRACRDAGHADERDRLTAHDSLTDTHERTRGVVVAALQTTAVRDAHAVSTEALPSDLRHRPAIGRDNDRADRRRDIDPGVRVLEELRDVSRDRSQPAQLVVLDAAETRF